MAEQLSQSQADLLTAAAQHRSSADWFDHHKSEVMDWPAAFDAARDHGVLPLLVQMLSPHSQLVGKPFTRAYQEVRLNHLRNMHLLAELGRIQKLFTTANIRVLPYKGPALALAAYGDLALRQAGDLDLLVAPENAPAAEQILAGAGYVVRPNQSSVTDASAHDYHREFQHPERQTIVELHWRVVGECFSFAPKFETLWQCGEDLAIGDHVSRIMSPQDTLLVLAAHGMKHFWSRLGWICDVAELMRRHPTADWQKTVDVAEQLGGKKIVLLAMQLAHDVCGVELSIDCPRSIRKASSQLRKHLFIRCSNEKQVTRGMRMELAGGGKAASLLFHWRMRERTRDGLTYVMHRMFTPTVIEKEWIDLPAALRPLYFLARPIRLALK